MVFCFHHAHVFGESKICWGPEKLAGVCSSRVGGIPPTLGTENALLSSCTWPGWLEVGSAGPAGGPVEQGLCQDGGLRVAGLLPESSG